jgi:DNA-binding transcriptional LysR family regulator
VIAVPFDVRHLRVFIAVCDDMNFHRAAQKIGIVQPAVSRTITDLERRVGARLLVRSTRSVTLTDAGRIFQEDARALLAEVDRVARNARLTAEGARGRLRIAYTDFAAQRLLPAIIGRFRRTEPDISLDLREMSSERQRRAIADRDIDIGLMLGPFGGPGLSSLGVAEEPLTALLPANHPLAGAEDVTWRQISAIPLIVGHSANWSIFRRLLESLSARHGGLPPVAQEVSTMSLILGLVAGGAGMTFYAGRPVRYDLAGIAVARVGPVSTPIQTCMVWPRGERHSIISRFVGVASEIAQEMAVDGGGIEQQPAPAMRRGDS